MMHGEVNLLQWLDIMRAQALWLHVELQHGPNAVQSLGAPLFPPASCGACKAWCQRKALRTAQEDTGSWVSNEPHAFEHAALVIALTASARRMMTWCTMWAVIAQTHKGRF